jgi:hypothetical protein
LLEISLALNFNRWRLEVKEPLRPATCCTVLTDRSAWTACRLRLDKDVLGLSDSAGKAAVGRTGATAVRRWSFDIIPGDLASAVILHVPHSSTSIPDDVRAGIVLDDGHLRDELAAVTDAGSDVVPRVLQGLRACGRGSSSTGCRGW